MIPNISLIVQNLFTTYKTCDPMTLAAELDIMIDFASFSDPELKGQTLFPYPDFPIISINAEIKNTSEMRFICGHELGHAILHKGKTNFYVANKYAKTKMEMEANEFSIELALLDYKLLYNKSPESFNEFSRLYGIPSFLNDYY